MPRRKQQAPKRAPGILLSEEPYQHNDAYDLPDVKEPALQNEEMEQEPSTNRENQMGSNGCFSEECPIQNSAEEQHTSPAEVSETDSESHNQESDEPTSDSESISAKNDGKLMKDSLNEGSEKKCGSDSLEQIKAIYKSFLSNSFWSSPSLNFSQPCAKKTSDTNSSSSSSNSNNSSSSSGSSCYDWHQSAIAKTLQQVSEKNLHPAMESSLFSTVQLYRQSARLYGSIFTGASKFHCKSCSASYDTLVDLTVHMNETGHYRDDNYDKAGKASKSWSKPRKRSLLEMEGKEDAQKVLRCMYCGHSFESLQDLSVHMIKTKHYQKVPLKEPGTSITAAKVLSSFRKRVPMELDTTKFNTTEQKRYSKDTQANDNISKVPGVSKESLSEQNAVSSALQHKSQVLRCGECGSPYESMQQLTAHIMLTRHFDRAGHCLQKSVSKEKVLPNKVQTGDKKNQIDISAPLSSLSSNSPETPFSHCNIQNNFKEEVQVKLSTKERICREHSKQNGVEEKFNVSSKFDYLTEEDFKESPKLNLDILKSLENTVTSAINKAQKGTPSWGGYQSIHAAYQLHNTRPSVYSSSHVSSAKQFHHGTEVQSSDKSQTLMSSNPLSPRLTLQTMEELVKNVTMKVAEEKAVEESSVQKHFIPSPSTSNHSSSSSPIYEALDNKVSDTEKNAGEKDAEKGQESFTKSTCSSLNLCNDSTVITVHSEPTQPFVNPLNALQSVMNLHLGKVAKPMKSVHDPMSLLLKMSNSMAERAALAVPPLPTPKIELLHPEDQPIDLSKGGRKQNLADVKAYLPGNALNSSLPSEARNDFTDSILCTPVSPVHESALSDISDMLRNLSDSRVLKSPTPSHKSEAEFAHTPDEGDDASMVHRRKGRQSHWNPQHLLILQAQFTSCLKQTADGKYVISDLSPQERTVISRVTGLSMTTISHWLANVKYQLRRTGRTKFLRNVHSGHPVFFCSECAIQIQTRSTYICHLESHLGFRMRDLAKFSCENLNKKVTKHSKHFQKNTLHPLSPVTVPEQLYPV